MSDKEEQEEIRVEDRRRFDREGNIVDSPEEATPSETQAEPADSTQAENKFESGKPERMNFLSFLYSLVHTALIQLGDVEDPIRKGVSENLKGAQDMIETLELLQEKTKGNLDPFEQKYLEGALFDLRMRYMQKAKLIKW
jgi:Domain of unknown function (DUF1844)